MKLFKMAWRKPISRLFHFWWNGYENDELIYTTHTHIDIASAHAQFSVALYKNKLLWCIIYNIRYGWCFEWYLKHKLKTTCSRHKTKTIRKWSCISAFFFTGVEITWTVYCTRISHTHTHLESCSNYRWNSFEW